MTGRRKSCKTCKKVAANSLPFVETSVPVVDGFLYQSNDHDENSTPGLSPRVADAISDPATAGIAAADAALGHTEPTPGFRKTASRKAAIQASSFTAVAQQIGTIGDQGKNKDGGKNTDKNNSSSCGDKRDPKDAEGCSDQQASKSAVAVSIRTNGDVHNPMQAGEEVLSKGADLKNYEKCSKIPDSVWPVLPPSAQIIYNHGDPAQQGRWKCYYKRAHEIYTKLSGDSKVSLGEVLLWDWDEHNELKGITTQHFQDFLDRTSESYKKPDPSKIPFDTDIYLFFAEVNIHSCLNGKSESPRLTVTGTKVVQCLGYFSSPFSKGEDVFTGEDVTCFKNLYNQDDTDNEDAFSCFRHGNSYDHHAVVQTYLFGTKPVSVPTTVPTIESRSPTEAASVPTIRSVRSV